MGVRAPNGKIDSPTLDALQQFALQYPVDFKKLKCECGKCGGFGQGQFKGKHVTGMVNVEAYHKYEYPGIHKATLHTLRAVSFYAGKSGHGVPIIACGYRCWIRNGQKHRSSTNHMGKAVDFDLPMKQGDDKRDDCLRCDTVRGVMVEKCGCQIGWSGANRKALEPSDIAPSWIHLDVRAYQKPYLSDIYFVKNGRELDMLEIAE